MSWDFLKNKDDILSEYIRINDEKEREQRKLEFFMEKGFINNVVIPVLEDGEKNNLFSVEKQDDNSYLITLRDNSDYDEGVFVLYLENNDFYGRHRYVIDIKLEHYQSGKCSWVEIDRESYYQMETEWAVENLKDEIDVLFHKLMKRVFED